MSKETKALTINPQLAAFQEELLKNYDKANLSAKKGQTLFVGSSLMEIFPIEKWEEAEKLLFHTISTIGRLEPRRPHFY